MKIQNLEIRNYKQFTDLKLDLIYPKGHTKEGQPLDKICIIGQSGTGKSNLLEIIKKSVIDFSEQPENGYLPFSEFVGKGTDDRYITNKFITQNQDLVETLFSFESAKISCETKINVLNNEKNYFVSAYKKEILLENNGDNTFDEKSMSQIDRILLNKYRQEEENIESNRRGLDKGSHNYTIEELTYQLTQLDEKESDLKKAILNIQRKYSKKETITDALDELKSSNFIDRTIVNINDKSLSFDVMQDKIESYHSDYTTQIKLLTNKLINDDNYTKESYIQDLKRWEEENENILDSISDKLNFILNRFNLQLAKIDENQKTFTDLIVKDLSNASIVEYDDLSTGTKNLISTFIPLKIYSPKDSIILIDEPENSFYPDIQKELIELYTQVGTNNQLIVATHSPIVASSFEPWEVVELKFDENNQIYRELYYKDENHIDNYFLDPRMLTWTSILTNIFDMKENSNFSFREEKLMEYGALKATIKNTTDKEEKKQKFQELQKLSRLLGLSDNETN